MKRYFHADFHCMAVQGGLLNDRTFNNAFCNMKVKVLITQHRLTVNKLEPNALQGKN